jgi:GDP-L-fucose synthase
MAGLPRFVRTLVSYRAASGPQFRAALRSLYPVLSDAGPDSGAGTASGHYFHQDLWAARKVRDAAPPVHFDVGSRIDGFVAHVLTFMPVTVLDIRPLRADVPGLTFIQADATDLRQIPDASVPSLSSLHAIEHFGLGRYGDPVDPGAWARALSEFERILAPGGRLYLSVPVGVERVCFNAHRVFSPRTIIAQLPALQLLSFAAVRDDGSLQDPADLADVESERFACGLFEFVKEPKTTGLGIRTLCEPAMNPTDRVYIAGHRGLVGSALVRRLEGEGFQHLVRRTHAELDLGDAGAVDSFFAAERPDYVFLAAARVGGILANSSYPADFIRENLAIELNVIAAAHRHGVRKLLFLGSSCIYPRLASQPLKEEYLLTGPLESTNEAYAIAKIAGIKMCQAYGRQFGSRFISVMPTNLYGPGDNFDLQTTHVLPALLRKFHEAKLEDAPRVEVWGSGNPRREFLHVDDVADACVFVMRHHDDPETILNIGVGEDVTIRELAEMIRDVVGYRGDIVFDPSRPDGTPRKLLDVSRLSALGWRARIPLREGIEQTYRWYVQQAQPVTA